MVPYENLNRFDNFEVVLISDLTNGTENFDTLNDATRKPDHSFLKWNLKLNLSGSDYGSRS